MRGLKLFVIQISSDYSNPIILGICMTSSWLISTYNTQC